VLPSIEERREQVALTVEDAMRAESAIAIEANEPVADVLRRAETKPESSLLLRTKTGEWRLLLRDEVERLAAIADGVSLAGQAKTEGPLPILFRDQSLDEALRLAGDWSLLPVVSRANLSKLEGVIALSDILHAFRHASQSGVLPTVS